MLGIEIDEGLQLLREHSNAETALFVLRGAITAALTQERRAQFRTPLSVISRGRYQPRGSLSNLRKEGNLVSCVVSEGGEFDAFSIAVTHSEFTGLRHSRVHWSSISKARITFAGGGYLSWSRAVFDHTSFGSCDFGGDGDLNATNSDIEDVRFENCSFNEVKFVRVRFDRVNFVDCIFNNVIMEKCEFRKNLVNLDSDQIAFHDCRFLD
jgi:hypothetical protein